MKNNPEKLKVAFLGGGINSAVGRAHRIAIEMDRRFELVSGCFSRHPDINKDSADAYGVPSTRTYPNLKQLIKKEKDDIHAIIILTPTPNHKDDVVGCLESGVPAICEKAMAASVQESLEIEKAIKKKAGFLAVTYNYTGYPMVRELKHLISRGKLGKSLQVQIEMPQEGFIKVDKRGNPQKPQAWRLRDSVVPTVSLDLGVHLHHIVDFLTGGKPLEVVATQHRFGSFKQIVDNVIGIARYTNNLVCHFWYGKTALGNRNGLRIRVYGEKGSAEWYQMEPEILRFSDRFGNRMELDRASVDVEIASADRYTRFKAGHPAGYVEAFANHYWDIADSLLGYLKMGTFGRDEYVFGFEKAKEGLVFLEAIKRSAVQNKWAAVYE